MTIILLPTLNNVLSVNGFWIMKPRPLPSMPSASNSQMSLCESLCKLGRSPPKYHHKHKICDEFEQPRAASVVHHKEGLFYVECVKARATSPATLSRPDRRLEDECVCGKVGQSRLRRCHTTAAPDITLYQGWQPPIPNVFQVRMEPWYVE